MGSLKEPMFLGNNSNQTVLQFQRQLVESNRYSKVTSPDNLLKRKTDLKMNLDQPESLIADLELIDSIVDEFENAWRETPPPIIEEFLQKIPSDSTVSRCDTLVELIILDMAFRWKKNHSTNVATSDRLPSLPITESMGYRPLVKDYLKSFPELAQKDEVHARLWAEEYRIRKMRGENPSPKEYLNHCVTHRSDLQSRIRVIDENQKKKTNRLKQYPYRSTSKPALANLFSTSFSSFPICFGDYEFLAEIARCETGILFKARQINLNRIDALKIIKSGILASQQEIEIFHAEVEAIAKLVHPNIVPVYEAGEIAGYHYFSMGFVDGINLAKKITKDAVISSISKVGLKTREIAMLVTKISEALSYFHERGIIHRDLKPENILIDENGEPKITDFRLVKQIDTNDNSSSIGQLHDAPYYMSPEQARGKLSLPDARIDIYSLGVILYELLTGQKPFQGNAHKVLHQILHEQPPTPRSFNSNIPKDLEAICLKCMEKDPHSRFGSAAELADELHRYLKGEPIRSRPIGNVESLWRLAKRKPVATILIIAGSVSLVLAAIHFLNLL